MKWYGTWVQLFALAFLPTALPAQLLVKPGVKAGLSIPELTAGSSGNPISSGYGSRIAGDIAVQVEFSVWKRISIQPQIEYSAQGGMKNGMQAFVTPPELASQFPPGQVPPYLYARYKSTAKLNYLMLPLLFKYRFHENQKRKWQPYVALGPFIAYLLRAKNETRGSSRIFPDSNGENPLSPAEQSFYSNHNVTDELHRFNAGVSGHAGLGYAFPSGTIFLEAGGNFGFIDIQKESQNGKNKTGAAAILIGYQFNPWCTKVKQIRSN